MIDTYGETKPRAYPSTLARNTADVALPPVTCGRECSPRANVAYSFLHTLHWFGDMLHHMFSREVRHRRRASTVNPPVLGKD